MKKRWFIYGVIGIVFGVLDFYFHSFISDVLGQGGTVWRIFTYGVWLVPLIPIILIESQVSKSKIAPSLVCSLTWLLSIVSYYLFMGIRFAFIGVETRAELHISNLGEDPYFLGNWNSVLFYDIAGGIIEWGGFAVLSGFVMGYVISFNYLYLNKLLGRWRY
ncbi:hypothetical protein [Lysinibacillus sp. BW-2-10]|uniref:hypothetical protein n=1 Tax=Lysinibacillus sp. BW-2-10 TaxID=2590030 RepID=UPI001180E1F6|nr:hypothetical protein [Lysinibacillus sp. BW-2-10]TSI03939.1 hypothetical protein FJQ64_15430 [Lysinibacillus sp. BW-2-10]